MTFCFVIIFDYFFRHLFSTSDSISFEAHIKDCEIKTLISVDLKSFNDWDQLNFPNLKPAFFEIDLAIRPKINHFIH